MENYYFSQNINNISYRLPKKNVKGKEAFWEDVSNHSPIKTQGIKSNGIKKPKERITHLNTPRFITNQDNSSHRNNIKPLDQDLFQYLPKNTNSNANTSNNNQIKDNFITCILVECRDNDDNNNNNRPPKCKKEMITKYNNNNYYDKGNFNSINNRQLKPKGNHYCFDKHKILNDSRAEKFNIFLNKYDRQQQQPQDSLPKYTNNNYNNKRTNHLYANAKIKNAYLEKIRNHDQIQKIKQETNECTFYPEINHKSRSIASADRRNVYERNIIWANNKNEKIQRIKKVKVYQKEEFSYKPKITDYSKEFNSKKTIKANASTILYLERQEKARHNRHSSCDGFKTKYKSCSTEPSKRSINITQTFLSQCKALLHEELVQSRDIKDDLTND